MSTKFFLYMKNILLIVVTLFILGCSGSGEKKAKSPEPNKTEKAESNEVKLVLNSNDQMQFDKTVLSASPGQKVTLTLNHTGRGNKMIMGHNFVLLKSGVNVDEFAGRAVDAKNNEYIPDSDDMIAYTKLIGGGESVTITFDAPETGIYTFVCTFPAHYQLMQGQLIVK